MNDHRPVVENARRVESIIEEISHVFYSGLPGVLSLMLGGSFGRGEGSTVMVNGVEQPFKDFDFFAIVENTAISQALRARDVLLNDAYALIGMEPYSEDKPSPGLFRITLEIISERSLTHLPNDISNVELKLASRVVGGNDLRDIIPVQIAAIPPISGFRPVLNKLIGMMEQWGPWVEGDHDISAAQAMYVRYHGAKINLDCAAAILLNMGHWVPGYRARCDVIRDLESKGPLHPLLGFFTEKLTEALEIKRHPDMPFTEKPSVIWKEAAADLLQYTDILSGDIFGYRPGDGSGGYRRFFREAKRGFFIPYAESWLRKHGISPVSRIPDGLVIMYSLFSNIRSGQIRIVHPLIRIYAAAWLWLAHHDQNSLPEEDRSWLSKHTGIDTNDRAEIRKRVVSWFKAVGKRKRIKRSFR